MGVGLCQSRKQRVSDLIAIGQACFLEQGQGLPDLGGAHAVGQGEDRAGAPGLRAKAKNIVQTPQKKIGGFVFAIHHLARSSAIGLKVGG